MKSFIAKHVGKINGALECFDRVILRGHLPLSGLGYCLAWLHSRKITLKVQGLAEGWQRFKDVVPELAERIDARISKPSVSHHFAVLKAADLIRARREGQQIYYALNTTVVQDLLAIILDMFARGERPEGDGTP